MQKNGLKLRRYAMRFITAVLLNFLMIMRVYAEPPTTQTPNLSGSETKRYVQFGKAELPGKNAERFYTDSEVDLLIDDLSEAAKEAVEKAAGEAAKAAALAAIEREAAALREAEKQKAEATRWRMETEAAKKAGVKNAVIAGLACLLSGVAAGVTGTLLIGGR